jgi:hypothetical protein
MRVSGQLKSIRTVGRGAVECCWHRSVVDQHHKKSKSDVDQQRALCETALHRSTRVQQDGVEMPTMFATNHTLC